jgi:hypothetical protein
MQIYTNKDDFKPPVEEKPVSKRGRTATLWILGGVAIAELVSIFGPDVYDTALRTKTVLNNFPQGTKLVKAQISSKNHEGEYVTDNLESITKIGAPKDSVKLRDGSIWYTEVPIEYQISKYYGNAGYGKDTSIADLIIK